METLKKSVFVILALSFWGILTTSCKKDEGNVPTPNESKFVSLESPYLICATRNPGGIGFDFEYNGAKGGANNLDSLTVPDFEYDLFIRTIKVEKTDGTLAGTPYIKLSANAQAVNYSAVDTTCKGLTDFNNLNSSTIQSYTLQSDDTTFNISNVQTGTTGSPLMQPFAQECNKLVIGQRWKDAAGNTIADDEPIWIIKTNEGRIVKFIVTQIPSNPAPTPTGYVSIEWNFIQ